MTTETAPAPVATDVAPAAMDAATAVTTTTDPSVVTEAANTAAHHAPAINDLFNGLGANVVTLMGFSFILGSLFTVLILVLLDYLRRNKQ